MTTYELTNACTCEDEDGSYPEHCWGCYDDGFDNLTTALNTWITALELSHVEIQGRGMGWTRSSGSATVDATPDNIVDALRINGEYRLVFEIPEGDDLADFDMKAMRYSHDEPTGASFHLDGLTTCDGGTDCDGECNFNFCEGRFTCPVCKELRPYVDGSGDCQTCTACCKCTEGEDGKIIYCMPY